MQRPEVIYQNIEDAEDDHQHDGTELGLEANNHHDTSNEAKQADADPPEAPVTPEDKADEEEDEQNAPGELEIHLAILLIQLWKTSRGELLAHPGVGQDHQKASHDGQVA